MASSRWSTVPRSSSSWSVADSATCTRSPCTASDRREPSRVRSELAWALRAVGPGAELIRVRRMYFNGHVALHSLVVDHHGVRRVLVLRRYVDEEWVRREPDLASREAK